jgi:hypothetical protein
VTGPSFRVDRYGSAFSIDPATGAAVRTETCNERSPGDGTPCSLPLPHAPGHSWERPARPTPFQTELLERTGLGA